MDLSHLDVDQCDGQLAVICIYSRNVIHLNIPVNIVLFLAGILNINNQEFFF